VGIGREEVEIDGTNIYEIAGIGYITDLSLNRLIIADCYFLSYKEELLDRLILDRNWHCDEINTMDSLHLFREVSLSLEYEEEVHDALLILNGSTTVSLVAEERGQEKVSFYGDGDVLILEGPVIAESQNLFWRKTPSTENDYQVLVQKIIPAIEQCKSPIEIVIQYQQELPRSVLTRLATAFRNNDSIVGFNVLGQDRAGRSLLKRACIETKAPIKWFQGETLSDEILAKRTYFIHDAMMEHPLMSEEDSKIIAYHHNTNVQHSDPADNSRRRSHRKRPSDVSAKKINERENWYCQMKEKLSPIYNVEHVENILSNLEMAELQKRIDSIVVVSD